MANPAVHEAVVDEHFVDVGGSGRGNEAGDVGGVMETPDLGETFGRHFGMMEVG